MSNQSRLFGQGYKFVYRIEDLNYNIDEKYEENEEFNWRRFNGEITSEVIFNDKQLLDEKTLEIGFRIDIEAQRQCFIAFCYPWSYLKNLVKFFLSLFFKALMMSPIRYELETTFFF